MRKDHLLRTKKTTIKMKRSQVQILAQPTFPDNRRLSLLKQRAVRALRERIQGLLKRPPRSVQRTLCLDVLHVAVRVELVPARAEHL